MDEQTLIRQLWTSLKFTKFQSFVWRKNQMFLTQNKSCFVKQLEQIMIEVNMENVGLIQTSKSKNMSEDS